MQRHFSTAAYNFSLSVAGIYAIVRKGTTDCYVGQSINIRRRWVTHRQDFKKNKHASKFMQRIYNKHGEGVFEFKILQIGMDPDDQAALCAAEESWIRDLKPIYNTCPVVGSCYGLKQSPETREKRSLALMGNTNAADSGWKMSAEQREKHSLRMMGNTFAAGHPSSKKGIPRTDDVKRKVSLTKTGVPWSEKRRLAYLRSKTEGAQQ